MRMHDCLVSIGAVAGVSLAASLSAFGHAYTSFGRFYASLAVFGESVES